MTEYKLIVDGKPLATTDTFGVVNPATGEVFAQCQAASSEHLDQAVAAARKAFPGWSQQPDEVRVGKLKEIAALLQEHSEELAQLLTREQGKPLQGFAGLGAHFEVGGAIAWTEATAALHMPVDVIEDSDQLRIEVHRKPLGVVGSITPWNYPLMIAVWHVLPALRSGNTVVLKPSEMTPLATARFVELCNQVLPAGVLNIVASNAGSLGAAMSKHSGIDKIVFTGSTPTGKRIMSAASATLKRLTLELGGNDAAIVLADADPKKIAPAIFATAFINSGQTCAALKRLYVHEGIYEELCAELAAIANSVKVGNGLEPGIDFGPVQNEAQLNIVAELADDARQAGARFLSGGVRPQGPGYFYPITLVADISDGTRLVDEEPFGPILPIIKFTDVEDALRRANASENGLGGSVWSADVEKATQLASRLECGSAWINNHAILHPMAPFGGVKQSGFGVEFGQFGLDEYCSLQTLHISK
ncbi:aldehyde dehydrogenase family protein [Pseudomaricurvus alcaniphilus]|uniref:aldehyde dehydrogenase family protein n=1 Tax=Pseudomaricurvus alcaniphilus TaxID=1166482 RepID=UPI0014082456|nr:aldehyde dehydrogenase family protein [Pseudomaricurvus alcaniphilus]NHN38029.1 aldehyde dehydrogenase family protein [Pseudomaricurvus alcaniphilus]